MKPTLTRFIPVLTLTMFLACGATAGSTDEQVGKSAWGRDDEIGRFNLMNDTSRLTVLSRIGSGKVYDLGVEYYIGMPSWYAIGDPRYQFWLTHTPHGTVVDDPLNVGKKKNERVSYTGDAVSMYTHMGTHIDALNHFGLNGKIWNGFAVDTHLGDRGWKKAGAETIPPIIARGILIDVAATKGLKILPPSYRVTADDLRAALKRQNVDLHAGDIALIRTGKMQQYSDEKAFMSKPPGLSLGAARFLVEEKGVMSVGADNLSFETFPPEVEGNWIPVHTYLLAQHGVTIMELVYLEELAKDAIYEFAFIGASLKFRGASAGPMRPIAIPLRTQKKGAKP